MTLYISALIGSILFIAIRLKIEKQKADDNPRYHLKWEKYFSKEWDDMVFSLITGLGLVYVQHPIFLWFARWQEIADAEVIYNESQNLVALIMGLLGSIIIMIVFKYAIRKANKLTE
jgi:uncharacterized membrane protein YeaQ/YmgE (transglycosylase-associated protein family)